VSISKKDFSDEKKLLVRLPKELHRQTRLIAFDLNVSMEELCRGKICLTARCY
jgi:predicted HicB family RNase H-like nuclease